MIELPEAVALSKQINKAIKGKKIKAVTAGFSPHKFAWYAGDPSNYNALAQGKTIGNAQAWGGMVEIAAGDCAFLFSDGVNLRFHDKGEKRPPKHQMLVEFEDGSALSGSVQMYGGLACFKNGEYDNKYYTGAKSKPSPLSVEFNERYFKDIIDNPEAQRLSVKALLATEQRIPGLGNGVLQDILFNAGINPKCKVEWLKENDRKRLYQSVKSTLKEMADKGGRDTEKDIYGHPGGYATKLSSLTVDKPCPVCGGMITKQAYMGGSVYFCGNCQKLG